MCARTASIKKTITKYRCLGCGEDYKTGKGNFYVNKKSPIFAGNDNYTGLCTSCIDNLLKELTDKYQSKKLAYIAMCHWLDIYFSEKLYEGIKDNREAGFGYYIRGVNGIQYKDKTFVDSVMELTDSGLKGTFVIREESEEKQWYAADLKNKNYVITSVGYDCFDDVSYSKEDRRFLFNTLANYLTDDVLGDNHKMQSCITMVKTLLQLENVNRLLNAELRKGKPDADLVNKLTGIKGNLTRNVNSTANENALSAKTSGKNSAGVNAITQIMKEMTETGFEEIKVNVVEAKLAESYKEVAADNIKAIMDELQFTSDEYAEMLSEQTEQLAALQEKNDILEEEIRKLKIDNKLLREKADKK